jgi:hypothetical protein
MVLYLRTPQKVKSAPRSTLHEILDVTLKCQFLSFCLGQALNRTQRVP